MTCHTGRISTMLALATLATAGCSDTEPTGPAQETAASNRGSAPVQARRIGVDAEFEQLAREAPGFGGMFYDAEGRLNVFLTAETRRVASARQNALARVGRSLLSHGRAVPTPERLVIRDAARDYADLTALSDRMFPVLGQPGVVFTDIDETQNRLTVGIEDGASAAQIQAALRGLGVPLDAVAIEVTPRIVPLSGHTLQDLQERTGGGLQIAFEVEESGYFCTLGFNVQRSLFDADATHFFTNSHCTIDMGTVTGVEYWTPSLPTSGTGTFLGVEVEDPPYSSGPYCGAPWVCRWSDAALVRYAEGAVRELGAIYRTTFFGTGTSAGSLEIDGSQPTFSIVKDQPLSLVGEVVNKVGRTTGWTRGPVTRNCVSLPTSLSPPRALLCQMIVTAEVSPGDSGSPVFAVSGTSTATLHGILWGGPAFGPFNFFVASTMIGMHEDFDGPGCRWVALEQAVRCPGGEFVTH